MVTVHLFSFSLFSLKNQRRPCRTSSSKSQSPHSQPVHTPELNITLTKRKNKKTIQSRESSGKRVEKMTSKKNQEIFAIEYVTYPSTTVQEVLTDFI